MNKKTIMINVGVPVVVLLAGRLVSLAFNEKPVVDSRIELIEQYKTIKTQNEIRKQKLLSGEVLEKELKKQLDWEIYGTGYIITGDEFMTELPVMKELPTPLMTYTTANGTEKPRNTDMDMYNWRLNPDGKSKDYIEIEGATWESRTKEFLKKAGHDNFQDWNNLALVYKIKTPVAVCIARADSGLGSQMKSSNNPGNVGNNDRGQVVHYDTPQDGIGAIYRVLNNKYLGQWKIIGELSVGGVKKLGLTENNRYYYATSDFNWNMNVLNCLSIIYDEPIDENFEFRF